MVFMIRSDIVLLFTNISIKQLYNHEQLHDTGYLSLHEQYVYKLYDITS